MFLKLPSSLVISIFSSQSCARSHFPLGICSERRNRQHLLTRLGNFGTLDSEQNCCRCSTPIMSPSSSHSSESTRKTQQIRKTATYSGKNAGSNILLYGFIIRQDFFFLYNGQGDTILEQIAFPFDHRSPYEVVPS